MSTLKRLRPSTTAAAPALQGKSTIKVVPITSELVREYNTAAKAAKDADATLKRIKPLLVKTGLANFVLIKAIEPESDAKSVILADEEGACVLMSTKKDYRTPTTVEKAEELFFEMNALRPKKKQLDMNDFVEEVVTTTFDRSVFVDDKGAFYETAYTLVTQKIEKLCADLGIKSPLASTTAVAVRSDFHEKRYKAFSAEEQLKIQEVLPFTVSLQPQADRPELAVKKEEAPAEGEPAAAVAENALVASL